MTTLHLQAMTPIVAAPPVASLTIDHVRSLLDGARACGGWEGALVELAILTLRPAHQVLQIELGEVDWKFEQTTVYRDNGKPSQIALGHEALASIAGIADDREKGQAITGGVGRVIHRRDVNMVSVCRRVASHCPAIVPADWNLGAVFDFAADLLRDEGESSLAIAYAFGGNPRFDRRWAPSEWEQMALAHEAIATWERALERASR